MNRVLTYAMDTRDLLLNHLSEAEKLLESRPRAAFMVAAVRRMILLRGPTWLDTPTSHQIPLTPPVLWKDRPKETRLGRAYVSPSDFIRLHYRDAYTSGVLGEDDLRRLDPELLSAYKARIAYAKYRDESLKHLLPPDSSPEAMLARLAPFATREELKRLGATLIQQDARRKKRSPSPQ